MTGAAVATAYRPDPLPIEAPLEPSVRLIPLGGLGEIGLNMMLVESGDDIVAVDCGLLFPDDEMPGVDYVIPDFSYLAERRDALPRGGAHPWPRGSHRRAVLSPARLRRAGVRHAAHPRPRARRGWPSTTLLARADLRPYQPGDEIHAGCFTISPIRVTHSVADGIGLAIETPVGTVIHTGDFKLDTNPVDARSPTTPASPRSATRA